MSNRVFETTVEYNEDFDEYYVTLPEELLELTGWEEGDILEYITQKDGSVLVKRSEDFYGEENVTNE